MSKIFLHQLVNAKELFEIVADEKGLLPDIVEKDLLHGFMKRLQVRIMKLSIEYKKI